ncbi:hypothetical protein GE09DRAFT_1043450 [Coniochaeta sp. 2T2.1]|nr:hypothetical protein GE09DRAFT_1043450 [Coniochaeta sp. 2T2.1]
MGIKLSDKMFQLVDAVYQQQRTDARLDQESRKALIEERRNYLRSGIGRLSTPGTESDEGTHSVTRLTQRLKSIEAEFLRNLDEKENCIWLSRAELAGIPDDTIASMEVGTGELDGKLKLNLNGMQARWTLTVASLPATREKIYLGVTSGAEENVPLFQEAIRLRYRLAYLLGYPNHLAYKVEITMARTPEAVMDLVMGISDRVMQRLPTEIERLVQLKKDDPAAQGRPDADILLWSDISYYTRLCEEENHSLDHNLIAQHFPLYQTISKMLALFGGSSASQYLQNSGPLTWHLDVFLYSVWNDEQEGGEFAGYLYLDHHPRPGKAGGAQCRPLHLGFERSDGRRHYPSTVLLTNFAKPAPDMPSLLQHSEVVLLFHELGHGIHDLSGRCKYSRFHGAETASDFNEAPSQMLENWCWDATGLKQLSGHYQTGSPLPDSMITSLLLTRGVLPAIKLLPQLRLTIFDTLVHSTDPSHDEEIDVGKIYAECSGIGGISNAGDDCSHGYASYRHLFSGADAGMYGYLWSKMLAMDMFDTVFKQNPLDDIAGRRYRHIVLEKGGSQDEMETFVQFLGRKPSSDAYYRSLGLG